MRYVILMLLALAGCATANSDNYAAGLKEWVGQSELSLYEGWGTPDNTLYLTPDEKVVTYAKTFAKPVDDETEPYSNEVYYPAITTDSYGYPSNGNFTTYYCRTSFTIRNGTVISYSFNGDDCVSRKKA